MALLVRVVEVMVIAAEMVSALGFARLFGGGGESGDGYRNGAGECNIDRLTDGGGGGGCWSIISIQLLI